MAPNFLAKLVKSSTSQSREGSRRGRTPSPASSNRSRSRTYTPLPSIILTGSDHHTTRSNTPDSSSQPSVTIIPPSPRVSPHASSEDSDQSGRKSDRRIPDRERRTMSFPALSTSPPPLTDDAPKTPTTARPPSQPRPTNNSQHSLTISSPPRTLLSSSSAGNLRELAQSRTNSSPTMPTLDLPSAVRRQSSNNSLKFPSTTDQSHSHAATSPIAARSSEDGSSTASAEIASIAPLVDSPTAMTFPNSSSDPVQQSPTPSTGNLQTPRTADSDISMQPNGGTTAPPNTPAIANTLPNTNLVASATTATTLTNASASSLQAPAVPKKKRSWRRGSTPSRKPTGLAGALAASGMAMAHVSTAVPQLTLPHMNQALNGLQKAQQQQQQRKSAPASPHSSPVNLPPRAERTKSSSSIKPRSRRPTASVTASINSENNSDIYGDDRSYSGLDELSSSDDSGSSDDMMDLDFGDDDIPVTGFAVASNKRNADFHELFPNIPEGDYLIEDYGCALQREILIQGRIYISENHVCFHSNIFGWVTDLSIPIFEVTALEKKMTAFVIPNAIQITTRQAKYTFASFLARDTTFDVIFNIWRLAKPEDSASYINSGAESGRGSSEGGRPGMERVRDSVVGKAEVPLRKATQCACGRDGKHFSETALETVLPGTPDRIHNLIFASGFIKDFMKDDQKLLDIQISDWSPTSADSKLLARNMSYIKPLSASIGPKQTKCEIRDETIHCDFDDYVVTVTTTRTPDVPSGNVFSVKTRTCIMWAGAVSSKVIVTTQVDWTGRSFIKGIIERSAIEGQKTYHGELDLAMRRYIQQHQSEFVPKGVDPAAVAPTAADTAALEPVPPVKPIEGQLNAEEWKKREHERNQRGLQWALDTFEGASQVAKQSARGAIELIKETWEQSTSTTICIFIIIVLVFSNLWTLMMMGGREEVGRRKELRAREKWIQSVVSALWEEMAAGKGFPVPGAPDGSPLASTSTASASLPVGWREEVASIQTTLDTVEERVRAIRDSLNALD